MMNKFQLDKYKISLRDEIVKSQQSRIDLLKYKLVVIAALGAVGLSLGVKGDDFCLIEPILVLGIIPIACVYIDQLCWHNNMRIGVIAKFLDNQGDDYEKYIIELGKKSPTGNTGYYFSMEDAVLKWSTIGVSLLISVFGMLLFFSVPVGKDSENTALSKNQNAFVFTKQIASRSERQTETEHKKKQKINRLSALSISVMGVFGMVISFIGNKVYKDHLAELESASDALKYQPLSLSQPELEIERVNICRKNIFEITSFLEKNQTSYLSCDRDNVLHNAEEKANKICIKYPVRIVFVIHLAYFHYFIGNIDIAVMLVNNLKEKIGPIVSLTTHSAALGYFLWFYCLLINKKIISPGHDDLKMLKRIHDNLNKIRYWKAEDNGYWNEKTRRVRASSIGIVVAALIQLKQLMQFRSKNFQSKVIERLIRRGMEEINRILPAEYTQNPPEKHRRCDTALLVLLYPLQELPEPAAAQILQNVILHLQGDNCKEICAISGYCPINNVEDEKRCIFDPVLSIVFGRRFQRHKQVADFEKQLHYYKLCYNRSSEIDCKDDGSIPRLNSTICCIIGDGVCDRNFKNMISMWTEINRVVAAEEMRNSLTLRKNLAR